MFVSVIFNVEYMDITSRKMWYLKNLFHCKENGWALITHDYLRQHFEELQESITDRFFDQFEMRRFTLDEVKDVEQYFVPDEIFDGLEEQAGSRTEMLFDVNNQPYEQLTDSLQQIFAQIQQRHPGEKIEGIFHCIESFESLRNIANTLNCPLINYSFSAFRKVHGYRQTMYFATHSGRFWDGNECADRFQKFLKEDYSSLPVFTNKELITIIGKEHTLPLMQLMDSRPKYEMGICCECFSLVPPVFNAKRYTDDDIFYECKKLYGSDNLKVRSHAAHLNDIQVDRSEVHNDPASTILSCKRLTAVQSQILLKVLLWNRTAVIKTDVLPFNYLCAKDYQAIQPVDLLGLNFYIFSYLIPGDLMFSDEYWKWRMTNPSETEIYQRHLDFLFETLSIDINKVKKLKGRERLRCLMESRSCDEQLIENVLSDEILDNINWEVASSKFEVISENGSKNYWRIDTEDGNGSLTSKLSVKVNNAIGVRFYPLDDVAGFARLKTVVINGQKRELDAMMTSFKYMPKTKGTYDFQLNEPYSGKLEVECTWGYRNIFENLNNNQ